MQSKVLKYARDIFSLKNALADICDFWYELLNRICEREANINSILSPDTIKQILILLARKTRKKNLDIGPITLQDLSDAFVDAVGVQPNDESAIMLRRLPATGRVDADSSDRQFLDVFILNGLRVEDIIQIQRNSDQRILDEAWQNPLDANGCAILSEYIRKKEKRNSVFLALASQVAKHENSVLAADIEPWIFQNVWACWHKGISALYTRTYFSLLLTLSYPHKSQNGQTPKNPYSLDSDKYPYMHICHLLFPL